MGDEPVVGNDAVPRDRILEEEAELPLRSGGTHLAGAGEEPGQVEDEGAARAESQPCQVNCRVIGAPRKPWKSMWSQAVFRSPMLGTLSMWVSPSTRSPSRASSPLRLEAFLLAAAAGSARVAPSPPPSRFVPDQDRTLRARWANTGASAVRIRVSPVLASLPA